MATGTMAPLMQVPRPVAAISRRKKPASPHLLPLQGGRAVGQRAQGWSGWDKCRKGALWDELEGSHGLSWCVCIACRAAYQMLRTIQNFFGLLYPTMTWRTRGAMQETVKAAPGRLQQGMRHAGCPRTQTPL